MKTKKNTQPIEKIWIVQLYDLLPDAHTGDRRMASWINRFGNGGEYDWETEFFTHAKPADVADALNNDAEFIGYKFTATHETDDDGRDVLTVHYTGDGPNVYKPGKIILDADADCCAAHYFKTENGESGPMICIEFDAAEYHGEPVPVHMIYSPRGTYRKQMNW